jgi:hypothetical protein
MRLLDLNCFLHFVSEGILIRNAVLRNKGIYAAVRRSFVSEVIARVRKNFPILRVSMSPASRAQGLFAFIMDCEKRCNELYCLHRSRQIEIEGCSFIGIILGPYAAAVSFDDRTAQ